MDSEIVKKYGNRVRLRVCGLCWEKDQLLMVNHIGITSESFWAPPGGGVEFNQTAQESLIREFEEETNLMVTIGQFKFACEFINKPLHAVELFFEVFKVGGKLRLGKDPESEAHRQILKEVRWLSFNQIQAIPKNERHGIFKLVQSIQGLKSLNGFYRI
jgi:8-oxo-dGTP diphosphatase